MTCFYKISRGQCQGQWRAHQQSMKLQHHNNVEILPIGNYYWVASQFGVGWRNIYDVVEQRAIRTLLVLVYCDVLLTGCWNTIRITLLQNTSCQVFERYLIKLYFLWWMLYATLTVSVPWSALLNCRIISEYALRGHFIKHHLRAHGLLLKPTE